MAIPVKSISQFKSALAGGGARPNLFEVTLDSFPRGPLGDFWNDELQAELQFMCKASSLPASTMAEIPVPFRGRILKVAGDRTFADWSITVINDEDFLLRNAFEQWMEQIAKLDNNLGATLPESYMTNAAVYQLGRGSTKSSVDSDGNANAVLKEYEFIDIFPTTISAIELANEAADAIETFEVTWRYQHFEASGVNF